LRLIRFEELPRRKNVVMQQMEHDDMVDKESREQQVSERRDPPKNSRSGNRRPPQGAPSILNDGLEVIRDSHC
jgi:hypothetical protein